MAEPPRKLSVPTALAPGTCPLCHTVDLTVTQAGLDTGEYWRCQRCGQAWDGLRLSAARAYAATVTTH